jgi:YrbI family 3-deoxy-D-manno-octulosonate 8-phosphate phosphatase
MKMFRSLISVMRDKRLDEGLGQVEFVVFDFDGVFTDNTVYVDQNGVESVRCWRGDGLGLEMLRKRGVELAVVSTETNPVVAARCKKLNLRCVHGVTNKALAVEELCKELNVKLEKTCFLGNDRNDIKALEIVGFPAIVADADKSVEQFAQIKTRLAGGFGAVRELCELISGAIDEN